MRLQKRLTINENMSAYLYFQVYNLFDHDNINQRYFQDNADIEWYLADQDGDGHRDYDVDGKYDDPRYWQRGRMFQMGVGFQF